MIQSENISDLVTALSLAQGEMQNAALTKVNPHFKSKYADLAAIREATLPALTKNGLSIYQVMQIDGDFFLLVTRLAHKSGQWIESVYPIPMMLDKPQVMGSAITYARRYSWASISGVASEEDDDANAAQDGVKNGTAPKRTREQISTEANRKRQDVRDTEKDILQIDNLAALARYEREVLTPDFMASLGMKQYAVEEIFARRKRELEEAIPEPDGQDGEVAKTRDWLIEEIQRAKDEDALLLFKEDPAYQDRLTSLPKPMQLAVRKAGALKMESLRMGAMSPMDAG